MKIVLLGYMASGKSTVGKQLSANLKVPFIDLDTYIEEQELKTVSEIFNDKGEIYFRKQEHLYLKNLLNSKEQFVLSLGGGTPCYAGNMDVILTANCASFYLEISLKNVLERLQKAKDTRPLVASISDDDLPEFIAKHLFERRFFYEQAAHKIKIDNTKEVSVVIEEIKTLL